MKSTKKWTNALWILNVIYLIVLTWLILLKGSVSCVWAVSLHQSDPVWCFFDRQWKTRPG